ncbi:MAG: hypothetical protein KKA42_01535 [candidate division Zixibacteria bacterium]|nr:hypothetical protein [candidate division Zixibacteria bacterium]
MLNAAEKSYCLALQALRNKRYQEAVGYFDRAADYFEQNKEFAVLRDTTRLLLAVKGELSVSGGDDTLVIEEVFSDGKEADVSR